MIAAYHRFIRRIHDRTPLWMRKHDFELFAAILCFFAGVPLLLSNQVSTDSMEAYLPTPIVKMWAGVLILAPILIFVGVWQASGKAIAYATFWLRLEALGLRSLSYAAFLYAGIIGVVVGKNAIAAMAITAVFALTCLSRSISVTIKVEDFLLGIGAKDNGHH